jgi:hypothetical protein
MGGGRQIIEAEKSMGLKELEQKVLDLYFPNGKSFAQGLELGQLNHFLASYTGAALPETIQDEPFTVERFTQMIGTNPIRIYLHTNKVCKKKSPIGQSYTVKSV